MLLKKKVLQFNFNKLIRNIKLVSLKIKEHLISLYNDLFMTINKSSQLTPCCSKSCLSEQKDAGTLSFHLNSQTQWGGTESS